MTKRFKIFIILNLFFIALFCYAVHLFFNYSHSFNVDEILQSDRLKQKNFEANVKEVISSKGYKAWFFEEHNAPIISIAFYFEKSGFAFDPEKKEGLASFVSKMLDYGTDLYDDETFHNTLEMNAVEMNFSVSSSNFSFFVTTPTENKEIALKLLKSVLTSPKFLQKDIEIVKNQVIESIKMQEENPEKVLSFALKNKIFQGHPKGRNPLGKIEDIQKITRADLKNFVAQHFVTDRLKIAVAGDISEDNTKHLLDNLFSVLQTSKSDIPDLSPLIPNYHFETENIERDIPQVISQFIAPGVRRLSQDFYPLYIANEAFGGSELSSRLNIAARENNGLTYGIYTYLNISKSSPMIEGGFSSSKENYDKVIEILNDEWQKMADNGLNQEEFENIKNNMLYSFNLRFLSLSSIASQLLTMQKENLGIDFLQKRNDYVKNVTLEEVNRVAAKYFSVKPSFITIGNNNRKEQ